MKRLGGRIAGPAAPGLYCAAEPPSLRASHHEKENGSLVNSETGPRPHLSGQRSPFRRASLALSLPVGVCLLVWLLATAESLSAQRGRTAISLWSGLPLPGEDLAQYVDGGFDMGVSVERRITDRWGILLIGGRSHLDPTARQDLGLGVPDAGPPVVQWRYSLGLLLELTDPSNPWEVSMNGGLGGATHDVQREEAAPKYFDTAAAEKLRDADWNTNFALTAQLRVGRDLSFLSTAIDDLYMFYQGQWNFAFADASDSSEFLGRDSLFTMGFGLSYVF